MKKYILLMGIFFSLLNATAFSLQRSYIFGMENREGKWEKKGNYCVEHFPYSPPPNINPSLLSLIPKINLNCDEQYLYFEGDLFDYLDCEKNAVYSGYLDPIFKKYVFHLQNQLEYCNQNQSCLCYWPETSEQAAQISDLAYRLFKNLIKTTALSNLLTNENLQREFTKNKHRLFNLHRLTVFFIAHQFKFSDYYHICKDIEYFANQNYDERDVAKIKDKLEDILEELYPKFYSLHTSCFARHQSSVIEQEIRLMKLLAGDISDVGKTTSSSTGHNQQPKTTSKFSNRIDETIESELENKEFITKKEEFSELSKEIKCSMHKKNSLISNIYSILRSFSAQSEVLLEQGSILNDFLAYKEAINALTESIKFNPSNRDAYIERATAYFETNHLSLALQDYQQAKKLTIIPPFKSENQRALMMGAIYIPESKTEFSKGIVSGTVDGAKVSAKEFIPSVLSCCRGILNGLWSFVLSPAEVSQEMLNSAYALGEYIASHSTSECLECVVPELRELSIEWNKINDYSRGQKIGFIIGKYGVDIFAPIGVLKGASKVKALKRANTMCTLEACAASQVKQAKILEESTKLAAQRELIIKEATKNNKILVRTKNVCPHVMQDHHHWEKVIKLTGNKEADFKMVLQLIEDSKIVHKANIKDTFIHRDFPISVTEYGTKVNGHEVRVFMENYIEKGEIFLKNAYVQTP